MKNYLFKDAFFSEDRKYRYNLVRVWDFSKKFVVFIGLNPSIADENKDDPTIRRCVGYAKDWGYGGLFMLNLFAYRSSNPKKLREVKDPIGSDNDRYIREMTKNRLVIAAWGEKGSYLNRDQEVISLVNNLSVLDFTKNLSPKHPLYLKKSLVSEPWIVNGRLNLLTKAKIDERLGRWT